MTHRRVDAKEERRRNEEDSLVLLNTNANPNSYEERLKSRVFLLKTIVRLHEEKNNRTTSSRLSIHRLIKESWFVKNQNLTTINNERPLRLNYNLSFVIFKIFTMPKVKSLRVSYQWLETEKLHNWSLTCLERILWKEEKTTLNRILNYFLKSKVMRKKW